MDGWMDGYMERWMTEKKQALFINNIHGSLCGLAKEIKNFTIYDINTHHK